MTVAELIAALEDMPEDAQVRIAHQPSWPFEYSMGEPVLVDLNTPDEDENNEPVSLPEDWEPDEIVYLPEGSQLGYLPGVVSRELGWR